MWSHVVQYMEEERQYIFLSDYYNYGGWVTFTVHLFHLLRKNMCYF
jgi:hypothetical protein